MGSYDQRSKREESDSRKMTQVPEDDSKAGEERCLETESLCQKMAGERAG